MKAGGVSVMRADLDAATSTSTDAHEAQWRAGVNRGAWHGEFAYVGRLYADVAGTEKFTGGGGGARGRVGGETLRCGATDAGTGAS